MRLQEMELIFGHTDGRTDGRNHGTTDGWTDRRGSWNNYLDVIGGSIFFSTALKYPILSLSFQFEVTFTKNLCWNLTNWRQTKFLIRQLTVIYYGRGRNYGMTLSIKIYKWIHKHKVKVETIFLKNLNLSYFKICNANCERFVIIMLLTIVLGKH